MMLIPKWHAYANPTDLMLLAASSMIRNLVSGYPRLPAANPMTSNTGFGTTPTMNSALPPYRDMILCNLG